MLVLGELCYEPCQVAICWTLDGAEKTTTKETGGTGQAIHVATGYNIPVFNLKNENDEDLLDFVTIV